MSTSIVVKSSSGLHYRPDLRSKSLPFNPILDVSFSINKINPKSVACKISFGGFGSSLQKGSKKKRNFVVYSNLGAGNPIPSGPPSGGAWKSWVLGIVISVILPFFTNKLGPLSLYKNKFDTALQSVENIVEAVEKVAEGVEKAAEDLMDDLPDGQLKKVVTFVEDIAEKTANHADKIDDFIDKVQEEEEKLEDCLESTVEKEKESDQQEKEEKKKEEKDEEEEEEDKQQPL